MPKHQIIYLPLRADSGGDPSVREEAEMNINAIL
jgi:hypothetical protein